MELSRCCQVIMATHSPLLMAYPQATLLQLTRGGLAPIAVEQTEHYAIMRAFCDDPGLYVETVLADE